MESDLEIIRKWRIVANKVAEVIKELYPNARVYVVGGAAEDRLTVMSDLDMLVVINEAEDKADTLTKIWEKLEGKIPHYYPLDIHIVRSECEAQRYRKKLLIT